jgi:hypothetical protein
VDPTFLSDRGAMHQLHSRGPITVLVVLALGACAPDGSLDRPPDTAVITPALSPVTSADLHKHSPPSVLLILDGAVAGLDSTAASRVRRDSILGTLTNRTIAQLEMYPPGDSVALAYFGSRAQHGVIVINTVPAAAP